MNPLVTPLRDWDSSTLTGLVGRLESDILDAKDFESIGLGDSRKVIRKAVAGFASSAGGTILIGATTKKVGEGSAEVIDGFPGIEVDEALWRSIRQGIYDSVRPTPVIEDRLVEVDGGRVVVVVVVRANPSGLPSSADGRYYQRVGDETKDMDWDEVRRRFEAVALQEERSSERADSVRSTTLHLNPPVCDDDGVHDPAHPLSPFGGIVGIPFSGPRDLGTTARLLRSVVEQSLSEEAAVWAEHAGAVDPNLVAHWDLRDGRGISSADGYMWHTRTWRLALQHDGSVAFLTELISHGEVEPHYSRSMGKWSRYAFAVTARCVGVVLLVQRALGLAGSSRLAFTSGITLSTNPRHLGAIGMPLGLVVGTSDIPLRRSGSSAHTWVRTLVQRMRDTAGEPSLNVTQPDFSSYLEALDDLAV